MPCSNVNLVLIAIPRMPNPTRVIVCVCLRMLEEEGLNVQPNQASTVAPSR